MGALEDLRDAMQSEDFDEYAVHYALINWADGGCPPYEPEPWGEEGVVPTMDGVYALHVEANSHPCVMVVTIRMGVISMEGNPRTIKVSEGGAGSIRFRYLCPLPTPPEDV